MPLHVKNAVIVMAQKPKKYSFLVPFTIARDKILIIFLKADLQEQLLLTNF